METRYGSTCPRTSSSGLMASRIFSAKTLSFASPPGAIPKATRFAKPQSPTSSHPAVLAGGWRIVGHAENGFQMALGKARPCRPIPVDISPSHGQRAAGSGWPPAGTNAPEPPRHHDHQGYAGPRWRRSPMRAVRAHSRRRRRSPHGTRIRRTCRYSTCDIIRTSAIRTPAVAATGNGRLAPELAAGIGMREARYAIQPSHPEVVVRRDRRHGRAGCASESR